MPTTPLYLIEHIVQGQNQAEVIANEAFNALEQALSGLGTVDASGTGSFILGQTTDARRMLTEFTGILTGNKTVTIPGVSKFYYFKNSTTGAFSLTVGTGAGNAVLLAPGFFQQIYCDGVNTFDMQTLRDSLVRTVIADVNLELFDRTLFCDTNGGNIIVTLPSTIPIGQRFVIGKIDASNTVTLGRNGNTINALTLDPTIATNQQSIELIGQSASNWLASRHTVAI